MTDRIPLDHLTSDALDDLYEQLERAQRIAMQVLDQDEPTPSRRAGLRDEIATAISEATGEKWPAQAFLTEADAVMSVLYRAWPWLRAEAEDAAPNPESCRQLDAAIKALGASETENAELRERFDNQAVAAADLIDQLRTAENAIARMSEADVSRVIDLYERWVKSGPPPIGAALSRWWDMRLAELHTALNGPQDGPQASDAGAETPDTPNGLQTGAHGFDGPTIAECRNNDRTWPLEKHGE